MNILPLHVPNEFRIRGTAKWFDLKDMTLPAYGTTGILP